MLSFRDKRGRQAAWAFLTVIAGGPQLFSAMLLRVPRANAEKNTRTLASVLFSPIASHQSRPHRDVIALSIDCREGTWTGPDAVPSSLTDNAQLARFSHGQAFEDLFIGTRQNVIGIRSSKSQPSSDVINMGCRRFGEAHRVITAPGQQTHWD